MGGFWKAPRVLAQMLAERELSPSAYALLHVIAEWGADRPQGFTTTIGFLASSLDVNEKTIRRALRTLRSLGLIAYEDHERVAAFTVRTADTLRTLEGVSMSAPMTARMSADAKTAADMAEAGSDADPASSAGTPPLASADMSEGPEVPDIETEIETREGAGRADARPPVAAANKAGHTSTSRNAAVFRLDPPSSARDLVAAYVDLVRDLGEPPPRRLVGQVARLVGELLQDGVSAPTIHRALVLLVEKRLNPSTLPSLIPEAAAGPRRDHEHGATATRRLALELRRREEQS